MSEYVIEIPDTIERRTVSSKDAFSLSMLTGLPVREEIIRCRDCEHYQLCNEGFCICSRGWVVAYDEADGHDHKLRIEVEPDGHCAWAVRRQ